MKVLRSPSTPIPHSFPMEASAITIGNFDGCHRGHQELISRVRVRAQSQGYSSLCLTFDPNPKQFFKPDRQVGKLFQSQQKLRALAELGLDFTVIQEFNYSFSQLKPNEFYQMLLKQSLRARAIVVGHDFRFGKNREGTIEVLQKLAAADDCAVEVVEPQDWKGQVISSSAIRSYLQERELEKARELLGRPYLLEGPVVSGKKLGRQLGFPTANIMTSDQLLPGLGVYAGLVVVAKEPSIFKIPAACKPCILNIGRRPTVSGGEPAVTTEVHILTDDIGPDALYGETLGVYLTHFVRAEQKFASLDELKQQIAADCQKARALLERS
ncbi:bifunctional riboflavin kinase/FAD synthetase [Oligoflexus tunisiensis]|uniref:bifunctional riboflavin kinase/FAD synthetase n=1 Tax=Oligoflexus tunisiensis TaxID=708132 RepID=UPI000A6C5EB7|nr:bifunctional riboflavin kinase/FAD synthetase [Oligoflexus tunisiensis]